MHYLRTSQHLLLIVLVFVGQYGGADSTEGSEDSEGTFFRKDINFASVKAGAIILQSAPGSKGFDNLLNDDKDKYGRTEITNKEKWVVIGLSEHVLIRSVVMVSYEKFCSQVKDFQVFSSVNHPVTEWHDLGVYRAKPILGEQEFVLTQPAWGRYLKFKFLSEYGGDTYFFTLSQIRVHGSAAMETLQQDMDQNELEVQEIQTVITQQLELKSEDREGRDGDEIPPQEISASHESVGPIDVSEQDQLGGLNVISNRDVEPTSDSGDLEAAQSLLIFHNGDQGQGSDPSTVDSVLGVRNDTIDNNENGAVDKVADMEDHIAAPAKQETVPHYEEKHTAHIADDTTSASLNSDDLPINLQGHTQQPKSDISSDSFVTAINNSEIFSIKPSEHADTVNNSEIINTTTNTQKSECVAETSSDIAFTEAAGTLKDLSEFHKSHEAARGGNEFLEPSGSGVVSAEETQLESQDTMVSGSLGGIGAALLHRLTDLILPSDSQPSGNNFDIESTPIITPVLNSEDSVVPVSTSDGVRLTAVNEPEVNIHRAVADNNAGLTGAIEPTNSSPSQLGKLEYVGSELNTTMADVGDNCTTMMKQSEQGSLVEIMNISNIVNASDPMATDVGISSVASRDIVTINEVDALDGTAIIDDPIMNELSIRKDHLDAKSPNVPEEAASVMPSDSSIDASQGFIVEVKMDPKNNETQEVISSFTDGIGSDPSTKNTDKSEEKTATDTNSEHAIDSNAVSLLDHKISDRNSSSKIIGDITGNSNTAMLDGNLSDSSKCNETHLDSCDINGSGAANSNALNSSSSSAAHSVDGIAANFSNSHHADDNNFRPFLAANLSNLEEIRDSFFHVSDGINFPNSAASLLGHSIFNLSHVKIKPVNFSCLDSLKYSDFYAKMNAKLNTSDESNSSGHSGSNPGSSPQDSIFKPLISKIKKLEIKNMINEMYTSQLSDCYRSILTDTMQLWGPNGSVTSSTAQLLSLLDTAIDDVNIRTAAANAALATSSEAIEDHEKLLNTFFNSTLTGLFDREAPCSGAACSIKAQLSSKICEHSASFKQGNPILATVINIFYQGFEGIDVDDAEQLFSFIVFCVSLSIISLILSLLVCFYVMWRLAIRS